MLRAAWIVFRKELLDALRDRRTLLMVLLSSVAVGPLVLVLLSTLVSDLEKRAEAREIVVQGMANAPTLRNYLQRQGFSIREAPADFEAQLQSSKLGDPVVALGAAFEAELASGESPLVEVFSSSANNRAQGALGRVMGVLQGFNHEQGALRLALRGVAPALLQPLTLQERDLANPAARASRLTGMVPFFVLMAVLYGALSAALDSTAGERERGSLEPLLMNPAPRFALVLGKWAAVAAVGMGVAVLSCASFLPAQVMLRSESLAALFNYGPREVGWFLLLLLPLAGALSALLMAIAIRCKSVKEAQASSAIVVMGVSLLPLLTVFNQDGEAPWHLAVPALAQITLMGRVLKGEAVGALDALLPFGVCLLLAAASLGYVVRALRTVALK